MIWLWQQSRRLKRFELLFISIAFKPRQSVCVGEAEITELGHVQTLFIPC